jgi:uncharacterized OsmC-like protein
MYECHECRCNHQWEGAAGSGHRVTMDGPEEAGGKNPGFRPIELMLLGLGFCMGYDRVMILRRVRKEVTGYQSYLTGQWAEAPPTGLHGSDVRTRDNRKRDLRGTG